MFSKKRMALNLMAGLMTGSLGMVAAHAEKAKHAQQELVPPSYADLADLADSSALVARAEVRRIVPVEPERARGVATGYTRYYIEARTSALIAGPGLIGGALRYLADLPTPPKGKVPDLKKQQVLLFALDSHGRPGELQLSSPDAQVIWTAETEARLRGILAELAAADAPPRIKGVREAIHVPGSLAGEGETQMFLATANDSAASLTVHHEPGLSPRWGVSFSEVVEAPTGAPPRDTLAWYRLACFLPAELPRGANLSARREDWVRAEADYRLVRTSLGDCPRTRRPG